MTTDQPVYLAVPEHSAPMNCDLVTLWRRVGSDVRSEVCDAEELEKFGFDKAMEWLANLPPFVHDRWTYKCEMDVPEALLS